MRMLLGLASLAAIALPSPASAQSFAAGDSRFGTHDDRAQFSNGGFGRLQGCDSVGEFRRDRRGNSDNGTDGSRRRDSRRGECNISVGTWVDAGEWALYNNRTWESDSYNDWWHDRPDRAYPRWLGKNENCDRMWYSGNVLRC